MPPGNPDVERLSSIHRWIQTSADGGRVLFMNALTGLLDSAILDKDDALLLGQFKELVVYGDTTFDTPTAKRFRSFLASAKFKNLALEEFDKVCASFSFLGPLLTTCPPTQHSVLLFRRTRRTRARG
jgi:hypothetical protein